MKKPPIIRGTFHKKGDVSEILRIPLGRVFPWYRVKFTHPRRRPGRVLFQTRYDGEDWNSGWGGAVTSQERPLEKQDGRECDFRILCTAAPAPIEYALTYVRHEQMAGTFQGLMHDVDAGRADFNDLIRLLQGGVADFDPWA